MKTTFHLDIDALMEVLPPGSMKMKTTFHLDMKHIAVTS
jgi:hypothetical protein